MSYHNKPFCYSFNCKFFILLLSFIILFFFESSVNARQVTLEWDPNLEPDLDHYVVYWGTTSGDYTDNSGNIDMVTTFSLTLPDDKQVYYFAAKAFDNGGLSSGFSNEVNTEGISDNNFP
ncbi:MAG: fibronectin type III domain-containing protein, partial [Deltaproteobacteria bacterium]|nr:fibronectin type III domain-containing protein [Deltaproteobacteria bacterium]